MGNMKEKLLKFFIILNIILLIFYALNFLLHIIGLSGVFYQYLYTVPLVYNAVYFAFAFIGLELMLVSIIIFTIQPKLSKNSKILLLTNLFIILLSFVFLFIKV
jgi:hypothetical protein